MKKMINKSEIKKSFQSNMFKSGSYSTMLSVAVIAIVIILNLVVNSLSINWTQFDISDTKLTELTETSTDFLEKMDTDVTVYLVAQSGQEDETLVKLLKRYKAENSHITLKYVDPAVSPTFASEYTTEDLTENSLIIESDLRSTVITNEEIYPTTVDYTTYSQTSSFDGESQISCGIDYVTSEELPVVYQLEGHGETAISGDFLSGIEKSGTTMESLNLVTSESVPEDCGTLIINMPTTDITAEEATKINDYIAAGGNLFITNGYNTVEMTNLASVAATFGVEKQDGLVVETDSNYYVNQYPYYLIPSISEYEATTELTASGLSVIFPESSALSQMEGEDDSLTYETLAATSSDAYVKLLAEGDTSLEQADGDEVGSFEIAVDVTKTIDDETSSKLVYVASNYFMTDELNTVVSGGNQEFVLSTLNWMNNHDSGLSILTKSLTSDTTLTVTSGQIVTWSILTIICIPITLLLAGIIIWVVRGRK